MRQARICLHGVSYHQPRWDAMRMLNTTLRLWELAVGLVA